MNPPKTLKETMQSNIPLLSAHSGFSLYGYIFSYVPLPSNERSDYSMHTKHIP